MLLRKETKTCKKHGDTLHGVYQYGNVVSSRCLECTRERKATRRANNEKYNHDQAYTKVWLLKNKDRIKALEKARIEKALQKRKHQVDIVLAENKTIIKFMLRRINSPLEFSDIHAFCLRKIVTPTYDDIRNYIIANKKAQLPRKICWEQSHSAKYHYGVIDSRHNISTYNALPEEEKEIIRKEYKKNTHQIVNKKISEICEMI